MVAVVRKPRKIAHTFIVDQILYRRVEVIASESMIYVSRTFVKSNPASALCEKQNVP
jgi:hypothetical protein